ncbi:formin-like protein isoform X4 [Bombus affinis]|uniref:Formin-like protein isoform X4 n=1 Tax=Bombus terrestris TaxID=30195 RepID=A0A9B0C4V1_BOMTE|nr:formin-like protein isoform X4 [Bombus terrestris]XP_033202880.1 formin-like protein isoform X2 [Bombus vancouverensis nearcticus]XP_050471804.1 formin-like protein isoform X2 [Bombus huntii]XP_050577705.1 formin-like protein isoform X4 [Bombus affinis]
MGIVQSRTGESDGGVREVFIGGIKGGTPLQSCQPSLGMGSLGGPHARSGSVRGAPRQPMPDAMELERRFTKVLASMDLPPDKAKLLKQYDNEKKWDIICDQERVQAKDPPSHYLAKLRTYLDPKASRSHRKRKMVGESTSTQVLRDLEISLRTNHIEWVREFLDEENQGLDALIDYLSFRLLMMRHEQRLLESHASSEEKLQTVGSGDTSPLNNGCLRPPLHELKDSPGVKRRSRHVARLNMGEAKDDIHVCILCMRAIMNNKYGFNMVIQHREAINCIALSLMHKSLRTKALVLELLAAICLVKGGHEIILSAFDNFKEVCSERRRFTTLMAYFTQYDSFHIEFMVACMQFVNIVVHSVEDMNFRVHLQYEFTKLGLDEYLEKLRHTESEDLQVQISAYLDNVFDVAALMEDSETKTAALEKVAELEDELGHAHDRMTELERESLAKLAELETELGALKVEYADAVEARRLAEEELTALKRQKQDSARRQSVLENKIIELETLTGTLTKGSSANLRNGSATSPVSTSDNVTSSTLNSTPSPTLEEPPPSAPAPPPPPPPPCPPPPPMAPLSPGDQKLPPPAPIPPPPAGMMQAPDGAMTIKRKVQTKYKLPTLNWIALKPNQVRGTIFNELDDDRLHNYIDFSDFEERFKIGMGSHVANGTNEIDGLQSFPSKRFKKPENVSLLEHTRLRNIAISRRKMEMPVEKVIMAVNALDLKILSLENVELLQRMVPTDQEIKAYREYIIEKKNVNLLTEEDKFLMQLGKVERISTKLSIMNYIGNFFDNLHLITPQIHAVISASSSVKSSKKLRAVLEIILAFGNYLNSSKRGPAYGFKLQSLDTLLDTKSTDKRMCLLHYIVATIRVKFPELINFESELMYIDKAATVSLENITTDVHELEKGMDLVRKEFELRGKEKHNTVLRDFLNNSEEKLRRLKSDARAAGEAFRECVEFFGESPRQADANTFFSLLVRFARAFKAADQENEQRRRLEAAAAEALNASEDVIKRNKLNQKKQQDAVINELKNKTRLVQEKKLLQQDEVYNGALEDILLGLRSEPYRRADAVRRSQRRRIDNHRLSRTAEELEL